MNAGTILTVLRLVLPVVMQIINIFHGKAQAEKAAQNAVDSAT